MKKLLLLGAFVAFGYMGVNAQSVSAAPSNDAISVATPSDDKPAKSDKKEKKDKDHKSCGDEKAKCKSGEKKSCCSDKGHKEETPAKKEDNK